MLFENVGIYVTARTATFVLLGNKGETSWEIVAKLDLPDYNGDEDKIVTGSRVWSNFHFAPMIAVDFFFFLNTPWIFFTLPFNKETMVFFKHAIRVYHVRADPIVSILNFKCCKKRQWNFGIIISLILFLQCTVSIHKRIKT